MLKKTTLISLVLAFATVGTISCKKVFFKEEPGQDPEALFENLWQEYHDHYGGTVERSVDWDMLYAQYRPAVYPEMTSDSLFNVFRAMLATLDDGHVQMSAPEKKVFYSNRYFDERIEDELFDMDVIKTHYLTSGFEEHPEGEYTYGLIGTDLLYLHLGSTHDQFPILPIVLDKYPNIQGLIVDLRHNKGGDFTWALESMTRLTDSRRLVFSSRTKNGTGPEDFSEWFDWYLDAEGPYFDQPIVLLTDRYTISAGERATMMFKALPNVTHVGDTTNGAIATMIPRELANGWYYTLPVQRVRMFDGQSYEGIGLIPDVVEENDRTELDAGTDRQLDAALGVF